MKVTKYAINVNDLRVVPATPETLQQRNYREISQATAIAIGKGEKDAGAVVAELLWGKNRAPLPEGSKPFSNVRATEFPQDPDEAKTEANKDKAPDEGDKTPIVPVVPVVPVVPIVPNVPPAIVIPTKEELDGKSKPELQVIAAGMKIEGYAGMKKTDLANTILGVKAE